MKLKQAQISELLDTLCNKCLEHDLELQKNPQKPPMFSDEDVMNMSLVYTCITGNRFSHKVVGKMTVDQVKILIEETSDIFCDLIKTLTGVDTKTFYKK